MEDIVVGTCSQAKGMILQKGGATATDSAGTGGHCPKSETARDMDGVR